MTKRRKNPSRPATLRPVRADQMRHPGSRRVRARFERTRDADMRRIMKKAVDVMYRPLCMSVDDPARYASDRFLARDTRLRGTIRRIEPGQTFAYRSGGSTRRGQMRRTSCFQCSGPVAIRCGRAWPNLHRELSDHRREVVVPCHGGGDGVQRRPRRMGNSFKTRSGAACKRRSRFRSSAITGNGG